MDTKSWSPSGLPRFVFSWLCLCLLLLVVVPSTAGGGIKAKVFGPTAKDIAKALSSCFFSNPDPPLSAISDPETQIEMRHNAIRMAFNEDVDPTFKGNYKGSSDTDLMQFAACIHATSKVTLSDIRDQDFNGEATQKALKEAIDCPADSTFDVRRIERAYQFVGAGQTAGKELSPEQVQAVTTAVGTCFAKRRKNREAHDLLMRHFFCTNARNVPNFFIAQDQMSKELTKQILNYAKCVLIGANGGTLPEKVPKELLQMDTRKTQILLQELQSTMQNSGFFATRFDTIKFAAFVQSNAAAAIGIKPA